MKDSSVFKVIPANLGKGFGFCVQEFLTFEIQNNDITNHRTVGLGVVVGQGQCLFHVRVLVFPGTRSRDDNRGTRCRCHGRIGRGYGFRRRCG